MDINLDQNYRDCLKPVQNIGYTLYRNICGGGNKVEWGQLDWVVLAFSVAMLLFCFAALGWVVRQILKEL